MSLGERIRKKRLELGWTQEVLASKSGLSKGFLSDIENDNRSIGAEKLFDIARVIGLSLDYLMSGEGEVEDTNRIEIPLALAKLASELGLSFPQTMMLLKMRSQIIAHRSKSKNDNQRDFNWRKFYESVKDFI